MKIETVIYVLNVFIEDEKAKILHQYDKIPDDMQEVFDALETCYDKIKHWKT